MGQFSPPEFFPRRPVTVADGFSRRLAARSHDPSQRLHAIAALRMFGSAGLSLSPLALESREECRKNVGRARSDYSATATRLERARDLYTFQAHRLVPPHIRRGIARDADRGGRG